MTVASPASAQTTTTSRAGIGDSTATPVSAWSLPAGLELARPITGYTAFDQDDCAPEDEAKGAAATWCACACDPKHHGPAAAGSVAAQPDHGVRKPHAPERPDHATHRMVGSAGRDGAIELQTAVWDLTKGRPLSAQARAWIDALPEA